MQKKNTIKIGFDSSTSLYTIQAPTAYSINNLELNGKPLIDPLRGYKSGTLIVTSQKPETVNYKRTTNKCIGYDNIEDHSTISLKEYTDTTSGFNREYDDDNDVWIYADLETEITATRFFRNHKRIYENVEEIIPFKIEMIEYPVSGFASIVPLYTMDAKNVFETKCMYTPDLMGLLMEELNTKGVTQKDVKVPAHSGIRYVQENNNYITGIEAFQRRFDRPFIGMYTECVAKMEETKDALKELIDFHFAKQSDSVLDKTTVGSLITSLQTLKNSVCSLDIKVKDESTKRALENKINELITNYIKLV
jgi:hypothetical protein